MSWNWTSPSASPIGGMITSSTSDFTTVVKAAPIMMPTAMSRTLPLSANSLNSFHIGTSPVVEIRFRRGPCTRILVSRAMARIAVFASGGGTNLEALLEKLAGHPAAEIVLVVSDRPGAGALDRARRRKVEAAVVRHDDGGAMLDLLARHAVDWIVLAGYLRRIPTEVVGRYRDRILNIHPALLPHFGGPGMYGERVHRAVIEAGERTSGVTVHVVDEEYDHGPIVAQRTVAVEPQDTPESLAARILEVEHELLPEVVEAAAEGRLRVEGGNAWIEKRCPGSSACSCRSGRRRDWSRWAARWPRTRSTWWRAAVRRALWPTPGSRSPRSSR